MNSPQPAPGRPPLDPAAPGRNWGRRLVNVLVALVVIVVAGATFVFSYDGVHAIALLGGVSAQLARYYPGLFDAVLVIACAAALMLRDGRWWARLWAWLVLIIVLGAIGTADVLHAMNYALRHRLTEGIVAAAPIVAVLLAFSLLLTLLRQSRAHAPSAPAAPALDVPALPAAVSAPPIALPAAPAVPVASPVADPPVAVSPATGTQSPGTPSSGTAEPTVPVPLPATLGPVPPAAEVAPATEPVPARAANPVPGEAPAPEDAVPANAGPEATRPEEARPRDAEPRDAGPEDAVPGAGPENAGPQGTGPENAGPEQPADAGPEDAPAQDARSATEPNEAIPGETPAVAAPAVAAPAAPDEPAPPTVANPAVPPLVSRSQGIRYAGGGRNTPPRADYWETEGTEQFAGVVYRVHDDDDDDMPANGPTARPTPPELDDDAPPFATAPFAPVPRLNRFRSTPTPPADEDE